MVFHDVLCFNCWERDIWKIEGSDEWRGVCPKCGAHDVRRVFLHAPKIGMNEDETIDAFQRDCRERFYKTGIDDVRHKHGAVADEAIRAADIKKIKGSN